MANSCLLCLVLISNAVVVQVGLAQGMKEVYKRDFLHVEKSGSSDATISMYWIQAAKKEMYRLEAEFYRGGLKEQNMIDAASQIRNSIAQVLEREELLSNFPPGQPRDEIVKEILQLYRDPSIAEAAFAAIGRDRAIEITSERIGLEIADGLKDASKSWQSLSIDLEHKQFSEQLGLTKDQERKVGKIIENESDQFEQETNNELQKQHELSLERWEQILEQLNQEQQKEAKRLFGKPVEWFRVSSHLDNSRDEYWLPVHTASAGRIVQVTGSSQEVSLFNEDREELAKHGVELIDSLVNAMLFAEHLWVEYELVEDQKSKIIGDIRKQLAKNSIVRPMHQSRFEMLVSGTADYPKSVEDLFLPSQLEWFRQIELQIRCGRRHDPTVGVLHREIASELGIDARQRKAIQGIGDRYKESEVAMIEALKSKRAEAISSIRRQLAEVLTESQLTNYRNLTGHELDPAAGK